MWINLPAALALVASLRWLLQQHELRIKAGIQAGVGASLVRRRSLRQNEAAKHQQRPHHHRAHSADATAAPIHGKGRDSQWREKVGSDLVAEAWEILCGSILQEVR